MCKIYRITKWITAALLTLYIGVAMGQTQKTVAVLNFKINSPQGELSYLGEGLTDMLIASLASTKRVRIVERGRLNDALAELGLAASGIVDETSATKLGKALGANAVLLGTLTTFGTVLSLDLRVVNVETGEVEGGATQRGKDLNNLADMLDNLCVKVISMIVGEERQQSATSEGKPARGFPEEPRGALAFVSDRDGNYEIYVMNADGSGERRLTYDRAYDDYPSWSPGGTKIAFSSDRDGNYEIYVMNPDGSGTTRLTYDPSYDEMPSWSPDGTKIAFVSDRDGNWEIYVMNADGTGIRRLTRNDSDDEWPSWSPNGRRIAFAAYSSRETSYGIYVVDVDTGGQMRLTFSNTLEGYPSWSPDGKRIAFASFHDTDYDIYLINVDGSGRRQLTYDSGNDMTPCWSPDGTKIAFVSDRDGNQEIYVMNADGSGEMRLTRNDAQDLWPCWVQF